MAVTTGQKVLKFVTPLLKQRNSTSNGKTTLRFIATGKYYLPSAPKSPYRMTPLSEDQFKRMMFVKNGDYWVQPTSPMHKILFENGRASFYLDYYGEYFNMQIKAVEYVEELQVAWRVLSGTELTFKA